MALSSLDGVEEEEGMGTGGPLSKILLLPRDNRIRLRIIY
jgi:hypothetical protein